MKFVGLISSIALAIGLVSSAAELFAHGSDPGDTPEGMIVTRHFSGIWDQVDQEAQGLAIQVVEQFDDSRKSVAYWYTYGTDRKTAWFLGIGDLIDNRIDFELFESTDVGFMQDADPGADTVESIGSMTIVFDSCDSGVVTYQTQNDEVGSGSFKIERLLEIMNTHCTGGISDDMHADGMFGNQYLKLDPARDGITGNGLAKYEDYSGHMEFGIEVRGLQDGEYHLYIGMRDQGAFVVREGHGDIKFSSPAEDGHRLMNFDPRGEQIEIHDGMGAVLSSFDEMLDEDDHGHHGDGDGNHDDDDHNFDCESGSGSGHGSGSGMGGGMGSGMGGGMDDCVEDGDFVEIEVDLLNTGVISEAEGEAEWEMNSHRVGFWVEIEDVPVGSYPLVVGGTEVGIIEAFEMHDGDVYGHLTFRDPETHGREHLDFEPRGQKIEVLQGGTTILEVQFPTE